MPPTFADIGDFLVRIIDLIFALGGVFFFVILLIIGFQWLSSAGDEELLQQLRERLTAWLIGFVVFFMSVAIVTFIYDIFGVQDCRGNRVAPGFNLVFNEPCSCGPEEYRVFTTNDDGDTVLAYCARNLNNIPSEYSTSSAVDNQNSTSNSCNGLDQTICRQEPRSSINTLFTNDQCVTIPPGEMLDPDSCNTVPIP